MTLKKFPSVVVLAILDGWGMAKEGPGNAISQSNTANITRLEHTYPHTYLDASGEAVGLPKNEAGNTETGHLNLGAGRIVYQDLERINMAIADGSFFDNKTLKDAINHAKKFGSNLHLMGLMGSGGVHSNLEHLFALVQLAKNENFERVYIHLFTDGRDSAPTSAITYINKILYVIENQRIGKIASIMGRYWAMDRDQRWNRTEKAYFALTKGEGRFVRSAQDAIEYSYSNKKTDEFIEPSIIIDKNGKPIAVIKDNDSVVFFNFRVDRPRQLTKAFVYNDFSNAGISSIIDPYQIKYEKSDIQNDTKKNIEPFKRGERLNNLFFVTMTDYGTLLTDNGAKPAFPPEIIDMPLGGVISLNELRQLRITESEKERFVTFYFNGLRENPYSQETRIIIPSPDVSTYDKLPEMKSKEITDTLISKLQEKEYKFILVNYPNADMVGHTGDIKQTIKAIESVDLNIGRLSEVVLSLDGLLIITADHGNAEEMLTDRDKSTNTEHSRNPVPFIVVYKDFLGKPMTLRTGALSDIAPTILKLLNLPIPASMTGRNLISELLI